MTWFDIIKEPVTTTSTGTAPLFNNTTVSTVLSGKKRKKKKKDELEKGGGKNMDKKKQLLIEDLWATLSDGIYNLEMHEILDLKYYIEEKIGVVKNG
tara:strand:- start:1045 stop:1335 length:291 start_codon:yes stop_codon:yes gene_type:complete